MNDERANVLSLLLMFVALALIATALLSKSWLTGDRSGDLRVGLWGAEACGEDCEAIPINHQTSRGERREQIAAVYESSWKTFGIATTGFAAFGLLTLIVAWSKRQPTSLRAMQMMPRPSRLPVASAIAFLLAIASTLMMVGISAPNHFVVGYAFPTFLVGAVAGLIACASVWPVRQLLSVANESA